MANKNKCLRDPVFYRYNDTPHHMVGDTYKVYPTYDFACPIVDSIEGVTHTVRTSEFNDRNDMYFWILDKINLRKPSIFDISRLNFVNTCLSKRKLQKLVDTGVVSGWDDPRFPTVRGILRRGLQPFTLKQFMLE
jgi:glutamyl/glutaminyl-tRNA synthetase